MTSSVFASEASERTVQGLEEMQVYLITMGKSDPLYTQGGHSLLRVVTKNSDSVYNWGFFRFTDDFALKFYAGETRYFMAHLPTKAYLQVEKRRNPRTVLQDQLNLTNRQKQKLLEHLAWWQKKENNTYVYHIWNKNCSTVVRDVLDDVLSNALQARFALQPGQKTYRQLWFQEFSSWPLVTALVDVLFNAEVSAAPNRWEDMFIPRLLRESLLEMPQIDDDGSVKVKKLISAPTIVLEEATNKAAFGPWGYTLFYLLLLPFLVLLTKPGLVKARNIYSWLLLLSLSLWYVLATLYGTLSVITPFISNRSYFYFGSALFVMWPSDFILLYLGRLFVSKTYQMSNNVKRFYVYYLTAHLISVLLCAMGAAIGLWVVSWPMMASLAMIQVLISLSLIRRLKD